jgi:hypothetical protein
MSRDDGGSAFPVRRRWDSGQEGFDLEDSGMTLRDYFAAHVIAEAFRQEQGHPTKAAVMAYDVADAMIEVRKKEGEEKKYE